MIDYDLTYDDYAVISAWRWSHIKLLEDGSPAAVRHAVDHPDDRDTAARRMGRAIHALALEGEEAYAERFGVYDGTRRGKRWEAWKACNPGVTSLKAHEDAKARACAEAIRAHPVARELLAEGRPEVTVHWPDSETGLPCKGRVDWVGPDYAIDLKVVGTVHERQVASRVAQQLWHGQLAHYVEGLRQHDHPITAAYIIAAEGDGAQDVAVYRLDMAPPDGALHAGEMLRRRLMAELAEAVALDEWPGRHPEVQDLILPTYALEGQVEDIVLPEGS